MTPCLRCASPIPDHVLGCPSCGAARSADASAEVRALPLVLMGLTLSGCGALFVQAKYGAPIVDNDEDGWQQGADCDDADPAIHPRAPEDPGDGIDSDCDGDDDQ